MKNPLLVTLVGFVALTSVHARDLATVVCGKPKPTLTGAFEVPVIITNTAKEAISFTTEWPDGLGEYATRRGRQDRWIRLNPPVRGIGGCFGYTPMPARVQTLDPGESFTTMKSVSVEYAGGGYFISVEFTRPESPKRAPTKVSSAAIPLGWNPRG